MAGVDPKTNATTTTTTTTSSDPKEEVDDVEGDHDLHVTPKKKKKDKKKNKEPTSSIAEATTINQIQAAMAQFGLHSSTKPVKAEKTSHAFWDTQPVPKKGMQHQYSFTHISCLSSHIRHVCN